ncbi:MAG: osmotically inducible protein OsmC [Chloroflexi bacterium]|nr:osmotically inducible protein OsmC [Chloroflexota bacterium]
MEDVVRARWLDGLVFEAEDGEGHTVRMDTSAEHGGGSAIRPVTMLLVSLVGCTAMDVVAILEKKRQKLTSFETVVRGERAEEHPKKYTHIQVEYIVRGQGIDPAAVERAIDLSVTKYCSVQASLDPRIEVTHTFRIEEEPA